MPYKLLIRLKKRIYRCLPRSREPNFFILGAGKCATTSMYWYLNQHPEVYFPVIKEPAYFAFSRIAGQQYNAEDKVWVDDCITDPEEYAALYNLVADETVIGDATPIYLYHPNTASTLYKHCPNAKFLVILRNPYERAYSDYRMHVRKGNEDRTFIQALEMDQGLQRFYLGSYLEKSMYGKQLKRYYELFDKAQFKIISYTDFISKPEATLNEVFNFLDIDTGFQVDVKQQYNTGGRSAQKIPSEALDYMKPYIEHDLKLLIRLTGLEPHML